VSGERLRLGKESALVALGALAAALLALRARLDWRHGVIGHGDAWQNVWNLGHVERWLRGGGRLLFTDRVWAPEGASLLPHTLSLPNSLPGALLGRLTGPLLAYDLLVVASYVLAAVAIHRLARRMGAAPWGAALGALVFAFAPQRSARALGHLKLLAIGWLALSLEALFVATRKETRRPLFAAGGAGLALALLAWGDWYLAICGAVAAACFVLFELVRGERRRTLAAATVSASVALALAGPYALALARESAREGIEGHAAEWCSTACTSLVIPSQIQLASRVTKPLTERNHQNLAEGAGYLGFVPLAATLWLGFGRRRERALDFALLAGFLGLILAIGPRLRVFDRLLGPPLPYALAEKLFPPLRVGGCPNRYVALAFLPLALGTALAATRLLARGRRNLVAAGAIAIAIEYAPIDPGVSAWPWLPPDPALEAIARSPAPGNVLDLDRGVPALVRQMRHGRPQLYGYLSREPEDSLGRRREDPVIGPLIEPERPESNVVPPLAAALLRLRWNAAFLVADDGSPSAARAAHLGFPLLARSEGRSIVWIVPVSPLPACALLKWSGAREAGVLAAATPGAYALTLEPRAPTRVTVRWGTARELIRTIDARAELPIAVGPEDVAAGGALLLRVDSETLGGGDGPALVGFERRR
jgi:hypothetical protein